MPREFDLQGEEADDYKDSRDAMYYMASKLARLQVDLDEEDGVPPAIMITSCRDEKNSSDLSDLIDFL